MKNPFPYSNDNKRYHTWNYFLKEKFGTKVSKVAINGGFTCPNIDGTRGVGGCTYCAGGSGEFAGSPQKSITEQLIEGRNRMEQKWHDAKIIPYFQANTNTYAPVERLRELYEEALAFEGTVGLAIATRADCIPDDVLDYLTEISKRTYLLVELGLQSVYDETAARINRGHSYEEFLECYNRLRERGINVCVHLIMGLPGETHDMMMQSVKTVAALRPQCIKLHLLHILTGARIAQDYESGEFECMELFEYVNTIVDALELLAPETVVQRLTGDGGRKSLIAPKWSLKKFVVMNEIDKEMVQRDTVQGAKWKPENAK